MLNKTPVEQSNRKNCRHTEEAVANINEEQACGTPEEEKRKRDKAIMEELAELEKLRRRHNLTFVSQEEGDVAEKASEELNRDIESAERCLSEKPRKKRAKRA